MALIISRPPVPITFQTIADRYQGITVRWIGADGSEWDLGGGAEGVVLQGFGTEGLHDPVIEQFEDESPNFHGADIQGWLALPRDVFWPLKVYADNSDQWVDTYARFFDSIDPMAPGRWIVGYRGAERELKLVGAYDRSHAFGVHPTVLGWGSIGVRLRAEQPFWEGQPIRKGPWSEPSAMPFIPEGGAPAFYLNGRSALGSATVDNPSKKVPAFPTWIVDGPLSGIQLGIGEQVIEPPNVPAGKRLVIDTDLRNVTVRFGDIPAEGQEFTGVDYSETLGLQEFAPIPPGKDVAVTVTGTGEGSVICELVPLHFRAM